MIYKLQFSDKTEYYQAKSQLHLLQSYIKEPNTLDEFLDIQEIIEISDEEAKKIMLINTEYDEENPHDMPEEISLFDMSVGDDFCMIGTSEYE